MGKMKMRERFFWVAAVVLISSPIGYASFGDQLPWIGYDSSDVKKVVLDDDGTVSYAQLDAIKARDGDGIIIQDSSGNTLFQFDPDFAQIKTKTIFITAATAAEVDSGFDLPAQALLMNVALNVATAESTGGTKTLDVGILSTETGGDVDCFADGLVTSATGIIVAGPTVTVGSTETYYSAETMGVSLTAGYVVGTDVDQDYGLFEPKWYDSSDANGNSISYTPGSAATELRGEIILTYIEIP